MALKRMDNVGIVVDDLVAAIEYFRELGLELEGQATVEGDWPERVTRSAPDVRRNCHNGHAGRPQPARDLAVSDAVYGRDHRTAPVNALGYLRVMFAVDDIDETLRRLREHGAQLVSDEVVQSEDTYRLCYIRTPEALLIPLGEDLG
jgi:catechol 2,3-dioxygenase-like lactoylglutathione lyase family enzyme